MCRHGREGDCPYCHECEDGKYEAWAVLDGRVSRWAYYDESLWERNAVRVGWWTPSLQVWSPEPICDDSEPFYRLGRTPFWAEASL